MFDVNQTFITPTGAPQMTSGKERGQVVWEAGKNYRGSGVTSHTDNPQK
jgi:hypothetical protein